ncbi:MAG: CocE/NonD family hydrolase [Bryobacterales bacterium]|nr:CocE/NonD family hydrolase [Bryobacterales bacterium]
MPARLRCGRSYCHGFPGNGSHGANQGSAPHLTSAKDTDFTAKLLDVHPDGRAINLTDGILRLRYREGLERQVLAEPGRVYAITIDAGVTNNVFRTGHRIRVEIASSNFPRFERNLNTGGAFGIESKGQPAEQTLYTGKDHASHIMLPVIPQ